MPAVNGNYTECVLSSVLQVEQEPAHAKREHCFPICGACAVPYLGYRHALSA